MEQIQLIDWLMIGQIALLCGIFLRLGGLSEIAESLKERVEKLENEIKQVSHAKN